MPTNEEFVVEEGMSPEVMARIESVKEDQKGIENVKIVENPDEVKEVPENEVNLDAPPEAESQTPDADVKDVTPDEEKNFDIDMEKVDALAKEQGMDADAFADKLFRERTFKVKVGGKEKEFDYHQIKSTLSREESSQKRYDKLRSSTTVKYGTLMEAAESGDKGAQKQLRDMMVKFMGAEDADDMNDKLEDVKDEYDVDKALQTKQKDDEFETAFADVKDDVDYQDNMNTIETRLKEIMPETIFDQYWEDASSRRGMYNLAASGRLEELSSAFQEEIGKLPLDKQVELEGDADAYGRFFLKVIEKNNAKKPPEKPPEDDGLSAVSTGTRPPQRQQPSETPDFSKMTSEEFRAWQDSQGIQRIHN